MNEIDFTSLLPILIVTMTPFVVELAKRLSAALVGKMPKWLTPILAAALGAVVDILAGGNGATGAALGGASTAVRDVAVNVKASAAAKTAPILIASVLLTGCIGLTNLSAQWETAISCQTYASTLRTLATFKKSMTPAQISAVGQAKLIASPICAGAKPEESGVKSLVALRDALQKMVVVQQEVKK